MFVWECIKSEGTHVGVCVDTFMFGSCCVHNSTTNAITASNHQQHHHHQPHYHQQHAPSSSEPLRPTLAEALGTEVTRPTLTSLSSFLVTDSSTARPTHYHPSETLESSGGSGRPHKPLAAGSARPLQKRPHAKPTSDHKDRVQTSVVPNSSSFWEKGVQSTKRPGATDIWEKGAQNTKRPGSSDSWEKNSPSTKRPSTADQWEKGSSSTKRPGSTVLWEKNSQSTKRPGSSDLWERPQNTKRPSTLYVIEKNPQSTKRPGSTDIWEKGSQNTRTPGSQSTKRPATTDSGWSIQSTKKPSYEAQSPQQKTRPDDSQHTAVKEKETDHGFQSHHQGFKDKVDTGHNTLVIRLPGKEHASSDNEDISPIRPSNQRPFDSRPDEGKTEDADLSVQETVQRPSVNSVEENVRKPFWVILGVEGSLSSY